jgi:hypothetical protein
MTEHPTDVVIDASHTAANREWRNATPAVDWHRRRILRALALLAALAVQYVIDGARAALTG